MKPLTSPGTPVMLFDGDCGFCQFWVLRWEKVTGGRVCYRPFQTALADYPQLTEQQCREAIRLVMPDGSIFAAAHAVFKALDCGGRYRWLLWSYAHLPFFGVLSEWAYRLISRHRPYLSRFFHVDRCRV